jgi:hypothetical protein
MADNAGLALRPGNGRWLSIAAARMMAAGQRFPPIRLNDFVRQRRGEGRARLVPPRFPDLANDYKISTSALSTARRFSRI